jgi:hypothetical protein
MPVAEYERTFELTKRMSELEAENHKLQQARDGWQTRVAVAESRSLAAETAAADERARAERTEAACKKTVAAEHARAQRAIDAAAEKARKAEAPRLADVRRQQKELA